MRGRREVRKPYSHQCSQAPPLSPTHHCCLDLLQLPPHIVISLPSPPFHSSPSLPPQTPTHLCRLDLLQNCLEPLLKLAAVLGTRHQGPHVQADLQGEGGGRAVLGTRHQGPHVQADLQGEGGVGEKIGQGGGQRAGAGGKGLAGFLLLG